MRLQFKKMDPEAEILWWNVHRQTIDWYLKTKNITFSFSVWSTRDDWWCIDVFYRIFKKHNSFVITVKVTGGLFHRS